MAIKPIRTRPPQLQIAIGDGLIVDNFAGGGGASLGIERAMGRHVDIAINHDAQALAMHKANHPHTNHLCEDVWKVDPRIATKGQPVALAWFSPDCTHFSRARGSKPVKKNIRGLAWVAIRWAATVRPRLIAIENVSEILSWGPVIPKTDEHGNALFDVNGEPLMIPDPKKEGITFKRFIFRLKHLGYKVEYRELSACDYGSPTSRKRLFMIARCDDQPIIWPEETHGQGNGMNPYRSAAECIDWSIPSPSIFTRNKPLADNTMARVARGIKKFILEDTDPFIAPITQNNGEMTATFIAKHFTGATGVRIDKPFPTILSKGAQNQLVVASLIRHFGQGMGRKVTDPMPTIVAGGGGKTGVVTSHLIKLRGTCRHGQDIRAPMPTITGGGLHLGEVRTFMSKHLSTATKLPIGSCSIHGERYYIADVGMRMLSPRELYRAQGFGDKYIIDPVMNGKPLNKTTQIRLVGNSVAPDVAEAIVKANCQREINYAIAANG